MNSDEHKMFEELIEKLAQARNLLSKPPMYFSDPYASMADARFVDAAKKTLDKARGLVQEVTPL